MTEIGSTVRRVSRTSWKEAKWESLKQMEIELQKINSVNWRGKFMETAE
jgi:hypothetical protein